MMEKFFLRRLNQYEVMTYEAKGAATHRWVDRTRERGKLIPGYSPSSLVWQGREYGRRGRSECRTAEADAL